MKTKEIRDIILKELPAILEQDKEVQALVLRLSEGRFADKEKTEDRFDKMLRELVADREAQGRRWEEEAKRWKEQDKKWAEQVKLREEQDKKWDEQIKRSEEIDKKWAEQIKRSEELDKKWTEQVKHWEEQDKKWAEQVKLWDEQDKKWAEQVKRWDDQDKKWAEQEAKWQENQKEIRALMASLKALDNKNETLMGAIGARWGLRSEQSFRNALKGILSEVSGLEVINVVEYDEEGEVFGRPDQIELDLVIKNGLLIICEIKSSVSKADIHIFCKKAEFYQKKHFVKADRLMVISPMIDKKALELAKNWGIKTYSYVDDIEPEVFSP